MSLTARELHSDERVLWTGKPEKKALTLPALGGIPFGLFFLAFFFAWLAGVSIMSDLPLPLAIMLVGWGFGVIIVPPVYQLKKYPNTEYMITDQRLIIQTWAFKMDTWFAHYSEIKDVGVRIGIVDKLLGTGTVYPVTPSYPFPPGKKFWYSSRGMGRTRKLLNPATGKYEEFSELQLWQMTNARPCLLGLKEPYQVQKLLLEAIQSSRAARTEQGFTAD